MMIYSKRKPNEFGDIIDKGYFAIKVTSEKKGNHQLITAYKGSK